MHHFHIQRLVGLKSCAPFPLPIWNLGSVRKFRRTIPSTLDALLETVDTC